MAVHRDAMGRRSKPLTTRWAQSSKLASRVVVIRASSPERVLQIISVDPPGRTAGSTVKLAHGCANGLGEWNGEFLINRKRFPPDLAGLITFYRVGGDVTQPVQRVSFTAPISELLNKGQSLGVVFASLTVFADAPLNVTEPPQRIGFSTSVTKSSSERQRLDVVFASLAVFGRY
jgi:hypothetical protein